MPDVFVLSPLVSVTSIKLEIPAGKHDGCSCNSHTQHFH
jgi:hypothetical protein